LLVQQHADQQGQRVVREQVVGGGVSGDVKGHASMVSLPSMKRIAEGSSPGVWFGGTEVQAPAGGVHVESTSILRGVGRGRGRGFGVLPWSRVPCRCR